MTNPQRDEISYSIGSMLAYLIGHIILLSPFLILGGLLVWIIFR